MMDWSELQCNLDDVHHLDCVSSLYYVRGVNYATTTATIPHFFYITKIDSSNDTTAFDGGCINVFGLASPEARNTLSLAATPLLEDAFARQTPLAPVETLPVGVLDEVLQYLLPTDVVAFGMASRWCRERVDAFYAHSLACLFSRFFDNEDEIMGFRRLQAIYGVLISGWCALQFFMNTKFAASPLDIYVGYAYASPVIRFLRRLGFSIVDPTLGTNTTSGPFTFHHEQAARFVCLCRGGKMINLIASKGPPLQVILSFHSTVVTNVITHDRAYSFFPHATFEQKLGMSIPPISGHHDVAREKYRGRGWRITRYTGTYAYKGTQGLDASNPDSDFAHRIRWVGDTKCLSVTLPPVFLDGLKRRVPSIEYNSWCIDTDMRNHPTLTFCVLRLDPPGPQYAYCCAMPVLCEIIYSDSMRKRRNKNQWSWHSIFSVVAPKVLQQLAMFPDAEASSIVEWFNESENLYPTLHRIRSLYPLHHGQAKAVA